MYAKAIPAGLTKEILLDLYNTQSLSQELIGKKFGVCYKTIGNWLRRWSIPVRTRTEGVLLAYACGRHTGENHPNWKGGRYLHHGYWMVRNPGQHGRGNRTRYILEHKKVWQEKHKRKVPLGWEVHHINGNKLDNRPENLIALKKRDHQRVIPTLQKRIRKLEHQLAELKAGL